MDTTNGMNQETVEPASVGGARNYGAVDAAARQRPLRRRSSGEGSFKMDMSGAPVFAAAIPPAAASSHDDGQPTPTTAGVAAQTARKRLWSAEQRVQIVLESLRGKQPNTQICRRYEISEPTLYKWRQLFLEGGKAFLSGAGPASVQRIAEENRQLREMLLDLSLAYHRLRSNASKPEELTLTSHGRRLPSGRTRPPGT
ncbi:MAG: Transposase [Deltaproteobacteria bacterium]|nr:Transposase [Deltaproteobacteria bacterium]